jgi:hypothetical protein
LACQYLYVAKRIIATKKDFICRVSTLFVAKVTLIVENIEAAPFLLSEAAAETDSLRLTQTTQWVVQFLSHVRRTQRFTGRR